jgi:Right handed beta helix region
MSYLGLPNTQASDWLIFKDAYDSNKIKARNGRTGKIAYNHATNLDNVLTDIISNITPAGTPTEIELATGDFPIALQWTAINSGRIGNIKIKGQGIDLTNLVCQTTITGDAITGKAIDIEGDTASGKLLTATINLGENDLALSSGDAATFAVGDYILLRSTRLWETNPLYQQPGGSGTAFQGEIHKVRAKPDATTITIDGSTYDTYTTGDAAAINKINMLQNITLQDLTVKPVPSGYLSTGALLFFKFIDNLQLIRVKMQDNPGTASSGFRVESVINSKFDIQTVQTGAYPFVELPDTGQYGIHIGGACQNLDIDIQGKGWFRHVFTTGGVGGTSSAGVQRGIRVTGTAEAGANAPFDTHRDCEGITFDHCSVLVTGEGINDIGPTPPKHITSGINIRAKNAVVTGCNIQNAKGDAIGLSAESDGAVVTGNKISQSKKFTDGVQGFGIRIGAGHTGANITGNIIEACENYAVWGEGSNHDMIVSDNMILNCDEIRILDSDNIVFTNNRIKNAAKKALNMQGTSKGWNIANNNCTGSAASTITEGNTLMGNTKLTTDESGDLLVSDGTYSWLAGPPTMLSKRKWGMFNVGQAIAGTSGSSLMSLGIGMLTPLTAPTQTAPVGTPGTVKDGTNGRAVHFIAGAFAGNNAGARVGVTYVEAAVDFKYRCRFRFPAAGDFANTRIWLGLGTAADFTGDDPLNALNGVVLGTGTDHANFRWMYNDAAGVTNFIDTSVAKDTAIHEVKIVCTGGATKWSVSFDNGAYQDLPNNFPGPTANIGPHFSMETQDAVTKNLYVFSAFVSTEK